LQLRWSSQVSAAEIPTISHTFIDQPQESLPSKFRTDELMSSLATSATQWTRLLGNENASGRVRIYALSQVDRPSGTLLGRTSSVTAYNRPTELPTSKALSSRIPTFEETLANGPYCRALCLDYFGINNYTAIFKYCVRGAAHFGYGAMG
jgi:hypothetical protein